MANLASRRRQSMVEAIKPGTTHPGSAYASASPILDDPAGFARDALARLDDPSTEVATLIQDTRRLSEYAAKRCKKSFGYNVGILTLGERTARYMVAVELVGCGECPTAVRTLRANLGDLARAFVRREELKRHRIEDAEDIQAAANRRYREAKRKERALVKHLAKLQ